MGAQKTKWSNEEEDALKKGVKKYGAGKWRLIQKDPVLGAVLSLRSNVDLKDKWRNMYPSHITGEALPDSEDEGKTSSDEDCTPATKFSKKSKAGDSTDGGDAKHPPSSSGGGRNQSKKEAMAAAKEEQNTAVRAEKQQQQQHAAPTVKTDKSGGAGAKREGGPVATSGIRHPKKKHKMQAGGLAKVGGGGSGSGSGSGSGGGGGGDDEPYLFLVNGQYRTAEEVTRDAARAVKDAERAAAAAEEAAEEAEICEREAWEAERLANELLDEAERQKHASDQRAMAAAAATVAGRHAEINGAGPPALFV